MPPLSRQRRPGSHPARSTRHRPATISFRYAMSRSAQIFAIDRPRLALAPEGEPDRQLVPVTDGRSEIDGHQCGQFFGRAHSGVCKRFFPGFAILVRNIAQGFDQQAFLALKMQIDDALAQTRFAATRSPSSYLTRPLPATDRIVAWISCCCRSSLERRSCFFNAAFMIDNNISESFMLCNE